MQLQAHRGVCTEYPENTMSAFWGAIYQDYKIIELDPNVTADGKFVILHDNTINRTARRQDGSMVKENREVSEMTYDEVAQYDYGAWFSPKFKGEKIPLLEEVLDIARENGVLLKIDNKIWDFPKECMESFWKLLRDSKAAVGITCKNLETAKIAVQELPDAEIHYDGEVTEQILKDLCGLSYRITVWLPFQSKETCWVRIPFATEELCGIVKQYAKLGIWIVSKYEDFDEVMSRFDPDIVETPGQVKPIKNRGCLVDMHTHSEHSHDSVCHICDMAHVQQSKGMYGFAVTDHCDIFYCENVDVSRNICESVTEVEQQRSGSASDRFHILSGLEMGEGIWYPQVMENILKMQEYDVVIGSVHIVKYKQYEKAYPSIDYMKLSVEELYEFMIQYLDDVFCMVNTASIDIMAHLLLPLRYINGKHGLGMNSRVFEDKIRTILKVIIQRGIALEVNTSCMDWTGQDWFEQDWLLSIYQELGGLLVTLGSDAHRPEDAAREFAQAVMLLKKHGFRNCFYYEKRRSIQCTIE